MDTCLMCAPAEGEPAVEEVHLLPHGHGHLIWTPASCVHLQRGNQQSKRSTSFHMAMATSYGHLPHVCTCRGGTSSRRGPPPSTWPWPPHMDTCLMCAPAEGEPAVEEVHLLPHG